MPCHTKRLPPSLFSFSFSLHFFCFLCVCECLLWHLHLFYFLHYMKILHALTSRGTHQHHIHIRSQFTYTGPVIPHIDQTYTDAAHSVFRHILRNRKDCVKVRRSSRHCTCRVHVTVGFVCRSVQKHISRQRKTIENNKEQPLKQHAEPVYRRMPTVTLKLFTCVCTIHCTLRTVENWRNGYEGREP